MAEDKDTRPFGEAILAGTLAEALLLALVTNGFITAAQAHQIADEAALRMQTKRAELVETDQASLDWAIVRLEALIRRLPPVPA